MERRNPWEEAARLRKVAALLEALDAEAERLDQARPAGPAQAGVLRSAPREQWRAVAKLAGCNPPSPETVEALAQRVEARTAPTLSEVPF